uniref:Uncharacterized protein n=1 Tax=Cucumis melo TaxID=3656 RepID=A0A9I9D8U6_CUCME
MEKNGWLIRWARLTTMRYTTSLVIKRDEDGDRQHGREEGRDQWRAAVEEVTTEL